MKTVRFAKVVEQAGKPEPYTLWADPKDDPHFQGALGAGRVVTVRQAHVGSKADYGEVGFHKGGNLLIFPKSLKKFAGARIVGIKYDLLESEERAISKAPARAKRAKKAKPSKAKPSEEPAAKFPPLQLFQPSPAETEHAPVRRPRPKAKPEQKAPRESAEAEAKRLRAAVGAALKKLERGNAVAAFKLLETAVHK